MKVRMLQRISGTRAGQDWPAIGETIDVPKSEGEDLVRLGLAEEVSGRESAVRDTTEKAVAPRPRGRPRKQPTEG